MRVQKGKGSTEYGPGIEICLSGCEIVTAIEAYMVSHNIYISGPKTTRINGDLISDASIYVDPSGYVIRDGYKHSGRTGNIHE